MVPPSQNVLLQCAVKRGTECSLVGMVVNLALALTKCTAGLGGHSFALVADGLESGADVVSGLVVLFGLKLATKPLMLITRMGTGKWSRLQQ
jgi:Co/Zn/Cd efflux system component